MIVTPGGHGLGWKPQKPDQRDVMFAPHFRGTLPNSVDLRSKLPPVYDQGPLGSCTGNAIAAALQFEGLATFPNDRVPSRLMIYYEEREIEGTIPYDAGAEIRDGLKAVATQGACFEDEWAYDISKFSEKPPEACYKSALKDRALRFAAVAQVSQQFHATLASGYPIIFGFTVYESMEDQAVTTTGILQMPRADEAPIGGHAVLACGYDDSSRHYLIRNSWGSEWGDYGYFWMPYEYMQRNDLARDFWAVFSVGG